MRTCLYDSPAKGIQMRMSKNYWIEEKSFAASNTTTSVDSSSRYGDVRLVFTSMNEYSARRVYGSKISSHRGFCRSVDFVFGEKSHLWAMKYTKLRASAFFERSLELITCLVSLALSLCLCNQQNSLITGFSLFTPVNYSKAWLKLAKYLNFTPERQLRAEEDWRQGKLVSLNQLRSLIPRRWRLIALHVRHGLNLNND